jgi:hypothetical protein
MPVPLLFGRAGVFDYSDCRHADLIFVVAVARVGRSRNQLSVRTHLRSGMLKAVRLFIRFIDNLVTTWLITFADAAFDDFHVWRRDGGLLFTSTTGDQGKKGKNSEYNCDMTEAERSIPRGQSLVSVLSRNCPRKKMLFRIYNRSTE